MVFLLIFLLFPVSAHAWSSYVHSLLAQESLADVAHAWELDKPIAVTSFDSFLKKFSRNHPEVQTREDFARWLKINPTSRFDHPAKKEMGRTHITPLEILVLYSPKADDGRDIRLPYDKAEQFWFGTGTRSGSQAFRHMEKPPFNPLHPLNTFGFPLGRIGQASKWAQTYFDLAVEARRLGEPYWAWNFLGVGLHYIEDLGQPYHTAQLLPPLAFHGISAYFRWGLKEKAGFLETMTRVASNVHHYFEGYTDYFLYEKKDLGKFWQKNLRGTETLNVSSAFETAKKTRDFSNRYAFESVAATFRLTGKNLLTAGTYAMGDEEDIHPENPISYLNPDAKERLQAASTVSEVMREILSFEGKAIRTFVKLFLKETPHHLSSPQSGHSARGQVVGTGGN